MSLAPRKMANFVFFKIRIKLTMYIICDIEVRGVGRRTIFSAFPPFTVFLQRWFTASRANRLLAAALAIVKSNPLV